MNENQSAIPVPLPGETSGVFSPEFEKQSKPSSILIGSQMMKSVVIPIVYIVITIVGILGNSIVIYIMKTMIKKHSVTDIYIINLAVADLLLLTTLPIWAAELVMDRWVLGDVMCKIISSLTYLNLYSSIFFLTTMSIDRWLAIVKAVACRRYRTIYNAKMASLVVWMLGGLSMIIPIIFRGTLDVHDIKKCAWLFPSEASFQFGVAYNVIRVGIGFFIPLFVILICYGNLIIFMYRRNKRAAPRKTKGSHIVTKMIFGVISCFVLCWLPNQVTNVLTLLKQTNVIDCHFGVGQNEEAIYNTTTIKFKDIEKLNQTNNQSVFSAEDFNCSISSSTETSLICTNSVFLALHLITVCLGFSNSMMNPILYFFLGPKYRNKLRQLCCLKNSRSGRKARLGLRKPVNLPILLKPRHSSSLSDNKVTNSSNKITRSPWKLQHSILTETTGGLFGENDESEYLVPPCGFRKISSNEEGAVTQSPKNNKAVYKNKRIRYATDLNGLQEHEIVTQSSETTYI